MTIRELSKRELQVEKKEEVRTIAEKQTVPEKQNVAEKQTAQIHVHGQHHLNYQEKMRFYNGEESSSLPPSSLKQVRDLHFANDDLHCKIRTLRHECSLSQDPLKILNDIEYCYTTISRNTGEILNIFLQNEKRVARISELENQNINLQQEITDTMSAFGTLADHNKKTESASRYFNAKSTFENNNVQLQQLKTIS